MTEESAHVVILEREVAEAVVLVLERVLQALLGDARDKPDLKRRELLRPGDKPLEGGGRHVEAVEDERLEVGEREIALGRRLERESAVLDVGQAQTRQILRQALKVRDGARDDDGARVHRLAVVAILVVVLAVLGLELSGAVPVGRNVAQRPERLWEQRRVVSDVGVSERRERRLGRVQVDEVRA